MKHGPYRFRLAPAEKWFLAFMFVFAPIASTSSNTQPLHAEAKQVQERNGCDGNEQKERTTGVASNDR